MLTIAPIFSIQVAIKQRRNSRFERKKRDTIGNNTPELFT